MINGIGFLEQIYKWLLRIVSTRLLAFPYSVDVEIAIKMVSLLSNVMHLSLATKTTAIDESTNSAYSGNSATCASMRYGLATLEKRKWLKGYQVT